MSKAPAFQFYCGDWMKDPALRACSPAARGLWIDCLCLMHESPRKGYLEHANGDAVTPLQLSRMAGCTVAEVRKHIREMEKVGVFSRVLATGAIFSRRMVNDEETRKKLQANGQAGGRPKTRPATITLESPTEPKAEVEPQPNINQSGNQNGGSSSSSSSSSSFLSSPGPAEGGSDLASERPSPGPKAKAKRKPNALFDAVAEATGLDPCTAGPSIGAATAKLAAADPPFGPEDVRTFASRFHEFCHWAVKDNRARPTPRELEKYIGYIRAKPLTPSSTTTKKTIPYED